MKTFLKINLMFVIRCLLVVVLIVAFFTISSKAARYEKNRELIDSIEEISTRKYTDSYKCLQFSRDLSAKLSALGIGNKIEIVDTKEGKNEYHAVVSVQIDPQTAKVVKYDRIDSCQFAEGNLECISGQVTERDTYIASEKK